MLCGDSGAFPSAAGGFRLLTPAAGTVAMREVQPDINILVSPIPERLFARAPEGVREWSLPLGEDGA